MNNSLTLAYAAKSPTSPLAPFQIQRRNPTPHDVVIDIEYCGVCHSDIHQARNEWQGTEYPIVPGHEVVGKVKSVGSAVTKYRAGDTVGVGCFIDSCRECVSCKEGLEQYCTVGMNGTYNSKEKDGKTPTYGGYSTRIVVDENYVLRIPKNIPLDKAAPLLCAGITTYSPLRHWKVSKGQKVAVMGLGGLGHMGVKLAAAMGAEVTVLSRSESKRSDAIRLGAKHYVSSSDPKNLENLQRQFDLILNTVSAPHDISPFLQTLKRDGTMVLLGVPEKAPILEAFDLIGGRRRIAGSLIGGIKETQEMLDFCAEKGIASDIETIPIQKINEAYERMIKGDVKYRFVIDIATLNK
jgi:uncharacterized zinc-type alcohol dehydrogenase-like protein